MLSTCNWLSFWGFAFFTVSLAFILFAIAMLKGGKSGTDDR